MTTRPTNLLRSTLIVMSGYLASKAVGLVREPLIARAFGASTDLDAYYAAFNIPDLLFTLIAGGALATAFIPVFAETLTQRGQAEAWRIASAVINLVVLLTFALAIIVAAFAPQLIACCLAPGFAPSQQALTVDLMRLILVSTVVFALAGVLMGILNAQQHFVSPAFAPALYNLGIIFGALALAPRFGVYGLAYGVIIGSLLHLASHIPPLLMQGVNYQRLLLWRDPTIRAIGRLMGPRILALGVIKVNTLVGTNLASRLGEGSVAALNLAWNVMQIPETIIATAIATAIFPTLSQYAAAGQRDQLRAAMSGALRAILLLSVPALIGLLLLGRPLVQVLYQGGRCDAQCADAIVWALQFYALGLLGHSFLEIGARTFYAQKDTLTPLVAAVVAMFLNALLAIALINVFAHGGIALANAIAVSCEVGLLLWIAQRRLHGIGLTRLAALAVRAVVAAAAMVAVIWFVERAGVASPIVLLASGGVASAIYFVVMGLLGVEEVRGVKNLFSRKDAMIF
ncbi:MAG: murein biosynthesis integral membrane protein MurJ [Chloroflexota bacterium]